MKRKKLLQHLRSTDCYLLREGKKHSLYKNHQNNHITTIPRHPDIKEALCRKICKDLGVEDILK